MKYTILINQLQISKAGLVEATDLIDWAIVDYISKFSSSPFARKLDGHTWINLKTLISEMPLLGLNSKQALSRRIAKHRELNIISCIYDDKTRMYAKLTSLGYSCIESDGFPVNPELTGCQRGVDGGVNTELTGCQSSVDINQTSNTKPLVNKPEEKKDPFHAEKIKYGVDKAFITQILVHRRDIGSKRPTPKAMSLILLGMKRTVQQGLMPSMEACLNHLVTETTWQGFKPEYLANTKKQNSRVTPADQGGSIAATHERMKKINWGGTPDDNKRI